METKEKDKKYSVILGIMILLFLIIVGITVAWGLGYIHFGKQVDNNNDISSESTNKPSNESQNQEPVINEQKVDVLIEAYNKHSSLEWVKNYEYPRGVIIEDGKLILNGQEKEITFVYGKPILATGNAGQSFDSIYVINEDGEVYVNNIYEVNYDYEKDNFKKINFSEKIVDMAFDETASDYALVGPYFMTETGEVLNIEGQIYK